MNIDELRNQAIEHYNNGNIILAADETKYIAEETGDYAPDIKNAMTANIDAARQLYFQKEYGSAAEHASVADKWLDIIFSDDRVNQFPDSEKSFIMDSAAETRLILGMIILELDPENPNIVTLLEYSARHGKLDAMLYLAKYYMGVDNFALAASHYEVYVDEKMKDIGDSADTLKRISDMLFQMYDEGVGVAPDPSKANKYLDLANYFNSLL